jgi:hypothetical protein
LKQQAATKSDTGRVPVTPVPGGLLQRKCGSCGTHTGGVGCSACSKKGKTNLQRAASNRQPDNGVPPVVHEVLRSSGQPLDASTRAFMDSRFGQDFSGVRVHTGARAAESARAVNALAYTVGRDVVFDAGQYQPQTNEGRGLLAHELTHVMQQSSQSPSSGSQIRFEHEQAYETEADRNALRVASGQLIEVAPRSFLDPGVIQRKPKVLGTKVTHPAGSKSPYKSITANFDGQHFTVSGDKKEIFKVSAQSGRPLTVRAADAKNCKGDKDDSYLNNPRYVGITDNGPIPEGEYKFSLVQMMTFSFTERYEMFPGGDYTDPFGAHLHGGDWGAGRVALTPVTILPSAFCGNTKARSGFYLHGGIVPGSSGCIDIGNDGITGIIPLLQGYKSPIKVTVKYLHDAPSVGTIKRAIGRYTYPKEKNPTTWDRIKSALGLDDSEPVVGKVDD